MPSTKAPLISIITVTYNAADTIPTTIASVDRQTFSDYEHLIIDGKSSDSTLDVISNCPSDKRKVLSERDNGIYDAMNKGISIAKGKYLIFLNSGDRFHSSRTLEQIGDTILKNGFPGVIYGQTDIVDNEGNYIAARHLTAPENLTYKSFAGGMVVCHQAFIALARLAPLYNLKYRYSADFDWCIQCLQHSRKNVLIPDTLIDYLQEGVTTRNHRASLKERFRIMSHYYGFLPTLARHLSFIPRYLKRKRSHLKQ